MNCFATRATKTTIAVHAVTADDLPDWLKGQSAEVNAWVKSNCFRAGAGNILMLPGDRGAAQQAVLGVESLGDLWSWGGAATKFPEGRFQIVTELDEKQATNAALGWALGSYRFNRYKDTGFKARELVWPKPANRKLAEALAEGICLTRDLVNTPASDMGPEELADAAKALARRFKAKCSVTKGDDLLKKNFPMVHAVGRASDRAPRLVDLTWGRKGAPKVTLVGKGVCFDSGGLDLKPSSNMLLMKKDMGGAAHVLGLAHAIMATGLDIRLRVLVPAVENSVSGNAFRPMDVLTSRQGLTVEIGNTDAEGRLILADALTLAGEEDPELVIDFATLTGASRVALGTEVPSCFTNDDTLAADLADAATAENDPIWRMPLHQPYRRLIEGKSAELTNAPSSGFGGAITAALFLESFLPDSQNWAHFDIMAWNTGSQNGRPEGGEAQGLRAVFAVLQNRYG